ALTQPRALSAREIQEQVLDPNTLLLEYILGDQRSYVFAVTPSAISAYQLPKRAAIEEATRRVYESLTSRNRKLRGETGQQIEARIAKAEREYLKAAAELSHMILGPVADELQAKRLLIVSDGVLQYI